MNSLSKIITCLAVPYICSTGACEQTESTALTQVNRKLHFSKIGVFLLVWACAIFYVEKLYAQSIWPMWEETPEYVFHLPVADRQSIYSQHAIETGVEGVQIVHIELTSKGKHGDTTTIAEVYDAQGRIIRLRENVNNQHDMIRDFRYDSLGRLIRIVNPETNGEYYVKYLYDGDHLRQVLKVDNHQISEYIELWYDQQGLLIKEVGGLKHKGYYPEIDSLVYPPELYCADTLNYYYTSDTIEVEYPSHCSSDGGYKIHYCYRNGRLMETNQVFPFNYRGNNIKTTYEYIGRTHVLHTKKVYMYRTGTKYETWHLIREWKYVHDRNKLPVECHYYENGKEEWIEYYTVKSPL